MKTLDVYIVKFIDDPDCPGEYCIDSLWEDKEAAEKRVEELDENIWWLLDKWFERNEQQYQEFIEIIIKCKQEGEKVNIENVTVL